MKKRMAAACVILLVAGCGMNENKETRIQKLEEQNVEINAQLQRLSLRVQSLESKTATDKK